MTKLTPRTTLGVMLAITCALLVSGCAVMTGTPRSSSTSLPSATLTVGSTRVGNQPCLTLKTPPTPLALCGGTTVYTPPTSPQPAAPLIGGPHFQSTKVHGDPSVSALITARPFGLWFEMQDGQLTLVAVSTIVYDMPVTLTQDTVTPAPAQEAVSANGCISPAPACNEAHWLGQFIAKPLHYIATGDQLTLDRDGVTVALTRR